MGLGLRYFIPACLLISTLSAAPKLQLDTATIGPLSIATGADGPTQTFAACNKGDGALNLALSSSDAWLKATPGTLSGNCTNVTVALQTASLAKGTYTGSIQVNDPAAVDAPQTVAVTVYIGGGVPGRIDLFAPAGGGAVSTKFTTSHSISYNTSTQDGQRWLSASTDIFSIGRNGFVYTVSAAPPSASEATYQGTLNVTSAGFAQDVKAVPVSLTVTRQPIAELSPSSLTFRVARNAPKQTQYVAYSNRGVQQVAISGLTTTGGSWLSAVILGNYIAITVDPAGMATGRTSGSVALASNAVNGPLRIPVELEVVAQAAPVVTFRGVVNNATYTADAAAPGDILAAFGEQFTLADPVAAPKVPLATELGGTRVLVNNQPVPLYYSSYGQINFQLPYNTPTGEAILQVERGGQKGNLVSVKVVERAPHILRRGIADYGLGYVIGLDGSRRLPGTSAPAKAGEWIELYCIGLGQTAPASVSGAAAPGAEPLGRVPGDVRVELGTSIFGPVRTVVPYYVGLTPFLVGLYQVDFQVPAGLTPNNALTVVLRIGNVPSNPVTIAVE